MNQIYIVVDMCSAHEREDMETRELDINGIRELISNHWDEDDFGSEEESVNYFQEVENNDIDSLDDKLQGIGYYIENIEKRQLTAC